MRLYIVLAVVMLAGSWAAWSEWLRFRRDPLAKPLSDTWRPHE